MSGEVTEVEPTAPEPGPSPSTSPDDEPGTPEATAPGWFGDALEPLLAPFRAVGGRFDAAVAPLHDSAVLEWWRSRTSLRLRVPVILTGVLCTWYFAVFERLVWLRHSRFGSFDYDLGMYDQGIWQLAHGRGFMTVRGMHVFGHHANIGYLLLVPFYWLGIGGPQFLDIVNTAAVVLVALPLFFLAYRHLRSAWAGFFLVVAYLFHFSPQWKIQETFHPESVAAPLIVGALYFATAGRWRWYWLCVGAALIWKEDVALAIAVLGIAVGFITRRPGIGAITVAISAMWFLIATRVIMAHFAPDGAVFDSLFGPLGTSATDLVRNAASHPSRMATTLRCHGFWDGKLATLRQPVEGVLCPDSAALKLQAKQLHDHTLPPRGLGTLVASTGFLSFLAPLLLLVGVPQHVVNYATTADFTWDLRWHYAMFPYLGALMGSVWVIVRRKRAVFAWPLIALLVAGSFVTTHEGVGPWTENHDSGWWPLTDAPVNRDFESAMRGIGPDDRVSAGYYLVPHLSHREYIYTFPNPWRASNYGAGGTVAELPDQNTIDQVVADRAALNPQDQALFDKIMKSGQFEVAFRRQRDEGGRVSDVVRLERLGPGPAIEPDPFPPPTTSG